MNNLLQILEKVEHELITINGLTAFDEKSDTVDTGRFLSFVHNNDKIILDYNGLINELETLKSKIKELETEIIDLNDENATLLSERITDYEEFEECVQFCKKIMDRNNELEKELDNAHGLIKVLCNMVLK